MVEAQSCARPGGSATKIGAGAGVRTSAPRRSPPELAGAGRLTKVEVKHLRGEAGGKSKTVEPKQLFGPTARACFLRTQALDCARPHLATMSSPRRRGKVHHPSPRSQASQVVLMTTVGPRRMNARGDDTKS